MAVYFAMIDGERCGPFTLEALHEAGVAPSTYVWTKGMEDWEQAGAVAEICRYYRQRIFDEMHPVVEVPRAPEKVEETPAPGFGGYPYPMPDEPDDPSRRMKMWIGISFFAGLAILSLLAYFLSK